MKWFWLGILALAILAATLLLVRRSAYTAGPSLISNAPQQESQQPQTPPISPENSATPIRANPAPTPSANSDDRPDVNIVAKSGGFVVTPKPDAQQPAPNAQAPAQADAQPDAPKPAQSPTPESPSPKPEASKPIDASLPHDDAMKSITDDLTALLAGENPKPKNLAPAASAPAATAPTGAPVGTPPDQAAAPAKITPQDDGSLLIDNRFVLKGKGTKDDPYRVSWEQLVSANESYQPRLGRTIIPDRLKMLDGKFVKISGYIAFPIMAQSADEMLVMLNQWDGCCIGVPPTPYDAIEVKLKAAAKGDIRQRMSGSVTGVLRVDPYLVKGWLVSLFLMDDGELGDTAGSTTPGQHATDK